MEEPPLKKLKPEEVEANDVLARLRGALAASDVAAETVDTVICKLQSTQMNSRSLLQTTHASLSFLLDGVLRDENALKGLVCKVYDCMHQPPPQAPASGLET